MYFLDLSITCKESFLHKALYEDFNVFSFSYIKIRNSKMAIDLVISLFKLEIGDM